MQLEDALTTFSSSLLQIIVQTVASQHLVLSSQHLTLENLRHTPGEEPSELVDHLFEMYGQQLHNTVLQAHEAGEYRIIRRLSRSYSTT